MINDAPQIHNLQQGSAEWHAFRLDHFGASEAAAMLGISKYTTRSELLRIKAGGEQDEVSPSLQAVFDRGHQTEALARPIAEEIIGDDLYPATYSRGKLSASCDGITLSGEVAFEHKQYNKALAESVRSGVLPEEHQPQCQQVLMVTGAEKLLFMVSDGTPENCEYVWVYPDMQWSEAILQGWAQFEKDLAAYVPPVIVEPPKAEPIKDLPAVIINASGGLSVCNLAEVTPVFDLFINNAKTELVTDEDFANGEETGKKSRAIAKTLLMKADEVIDQISTVGDAVRTLKLYAEKFNALGLTMEKAVKEQKETIKGQIMAKARQAYTLHIAALETEIEPIRLVCAQPDFAAAMKNQRTLASLHGKVNDALANAKITADAAAKDIRAKLTWIKQHAEQYRFLLNDMQQIIQKPFDDFTLLVNSRIDAHKKAEADKLEADRKRIQAEEEAKAQAKVQAEQAAAKKKPDDEAMELAQRDQLETGTGVVKISADSIEHVPVSKFLSAPPTPEEKRAVVIEHQDEIAEFMASREWGKDANKIRAVLVEFVKFRAIRGAVPESIAA